MLLTTQVEDALQEYRDTRLTRSAAVQVCTVHVRAWYMHVTCTCMVYAWYMHGTCVRASRARLSYRYMRGTCTCMVHAHAHAWYMHMHGTCTCMVHAPHALGRGAGPPPLYPVSVLHSTLCTGPLALRERHANPSLTPPPTPLTRASPASRATSSYAASTRRASWASTTASHSKYSQSK